MNISPQYFQHEMPNQFEAEQDSIFNSAFSLNINQKLMKKIEKEYLTMKSKKTEDEMEIRVSLAWLLNKKKHQEQRMIFY